MAAQLRAAPLVSAWKFKPETIRQVFFPGNPRHLTDHLPPDHNLRLVLESRAPVKLAEADQLDTATRVLDTVLAYKGIPAYKTQTQYYGKGRDGAPVRSCNYACESAGKHREEKRPDRLAVDESKKRAKGQGKVSYLAMPLLRPVGHMFL